MNTQEGSKSFSLLGLHLLRPPRRGFQGDFPVFLLLRACTQPFLLFPDTVATDCCRQSHPSRQTQEGIFLRSWLSVGACPLLVSLKVGEEGTLSLCSLTTCPGWPPKREGHPSRSLLSKRRQLSPSVRRPALWEVQKHCGGRGHERQQDSRPGLSRETVALGVEPLCR